MWWNPFTFEEGQWYLWRFAGAEIAVCRTEETWQGFCKSLRWEKRDASCTGPLQEKPAVQTALQTNVLNAKTASLRPFLPEKPFLINLGGLKLYPGMKITLELEIPPALYLMAEKDGNTPEFIFNFVPFTLKETWHGKNSMEGFFCSSLPVNTGVPCNPAIHCSLTIRNRTKNAAELNAIPFYAGGLSVYEKDRKLISESPVIDTLENNFRMAVETADTEYGTMLTQGNKNDPNLIRRGTSALSDLGGGLQQGTRIIKNITGL